MYCTFLKPLISGAYSLGESIWSPLRKTSLPSDAKKLKEGRDGKSIKQAGEVYCKKEGKNLVTLRGLGESNLACDVASALPTMTKNIHCYHPGSN